jgi:hypothetical protein
MAIKVSTCIICSMNRVEDSRSRALTLYTIINARCVHAL